MRSLGLGVRGALLAGLCALVLQAQDGRPGPLTTPEIKQIVPAVYFFRGQSATVQVRNASGFRTSSGKLVLAALVDTSGYAHDVAEKYQGLLITEVKLSVGGKELGPGAYGFGFIDDARLVVMDVGANEVLSTSTSVNEQMMHPVPLKMEPDGNGYRFYSGRKWVGLKVE